MKEHLKKKIREFEEALEPGENLRFYIGEDDYVLDINNVPDILTEGSFLDGPEASQAIEVYAAVDGWDFGPDGPEWREELRRHLGTITFTAEDV